MYGLLMRVSAEAVKEFCAKKRHLGALPGVLSVLHTWNGRLGYHPHVRMLITGGGITHDGEHWEPARGEFLVPVGVLSRKIAAKFHDALKKKDPGVFASIPARAWRREWVTFSKHYGHGNDAVLDYLSRYVFRTAIGDGRILAMDRTQETWHHYATPCEVTATCLRLDYPWRQARLYHYPRVEAGHDSGPSSSSTKTIPTSRR